MQIATWNVNSVRTRLQHVLNWLDSDIGRSVDVLCLQETKVQDSQFPLAAFEEAGLHVSFYGQKAYNGVALVSRTPLESVTCGFEAVVGAAGQEFDEQKRVIAGVLRGVRIVNLYVPNGSAVDSDKYRYKLGWLKVLEAYLKSYLEPARETARLVVCGDFNIALEDIDIYNPDRKDIDTHIMSSPREREALREILAFGLQDTFRKFTSEGGHFSWWDYRSGGFPRNRGWRIDHLYASAAVYEQAIACTIDREPRGWEKPSDHTPVILELEEE